MAASGKAGKADKAPSEMTENDWRRVLTPEEFGLTREAGTEAPFTGRFDKHMKPGRYTCLCCGASLFLSESKFNSGCGWPAFSAADGAKKGDETDANVVRLPDDSLVGRPRVEVRCKQCNAHLGHVFDDGPQPTGERFCINSGAIDFEPGHGSK